jgi:phytoene dehydrogenase-like protein
VRIAVVGAGAAGLVAATCLKEKGHEVVVLEAEDRIGGRIQTVELAPGWRIDVGAHAFGTDCVHLLALCKGFEYRIFTPWPWGLPDLVVGAERLAPLWSDSAATGGRLPTD